MDSNAIRSKFLSFFSERGHTVMPGSSLVPEEPSLLLTTAGMVQFIPYFRGEKKPEHTRMTSVQRCLRTTDIDKVGHTARHLTFFEMLGNFSVGDYYKKEVIPWSWEFVTKELGIDPNDLWVSVFLDDDESFNIWRDEVGVPENRIVRLGEDENFWSMGPTGPCGPCSEIHFDFGPEKACGPDCALGCECDRFLEIWNLVFMQYNRDEDGELHPLPKKNIDTGMGLERVASVLQNVPNNFETDLLRTLIDEVCAASSAVYGSDPRTDVSLKIVGDHMRAVVFMVNDGIFPSNEGRGYVLRRLLRRAIRHGRILGIDEPFAAGIAASVIDLMGPSYSDVVKNKKSIIDVVVNEERRFLETLKTGLSVLDGFLEESVASGADTVDAQAAFKLYDTYGFPLELTVEIAAERGLSVDTIGFVKLADKAKAKAKSSGGAFQTGPADSLYADVLEAAGKTEFCGYQSVEAATEIAAIIDQGTVVKEAGSGGAVEIVLRQTPFYAEMGGQVGDTGQIRTDTGVFSVKETLSPLPGLITHRGEVLSGTLGAGQAANAVVDAERRWAIRRNHTATHIIHWALRQVLGEHVRQGGSHVDETRLRFDFTHGAALTRAELMRVETLSNKRLLENAPVRAYTTTYAYATESGALAFFGEKYGKHVRVLEVGDFSRELCGGTHAARTGDIGQIRITSEGSVGANLRRLEAVTGEAALALAQQTDELLTELESKTKSNRAVLGKRIEHLLSELKEKEREAASLKAKLDAAGSASLLGNADKSGDTALVFAVLAEKDMDDLRNIADDIRGRTSSAAIGLSSAKNGSVSLLLALSKDIAGTRLNAADIIRPTASLIGGGGGGRADLAQAGGKISGGMQAAVDELRKAVEKGLK
jgi:alanyl-tRNA synthetase